MLTVAAAPAVGAAADSEAAVISRVDVVTVEGVLDPTVAGTITATIAAAEQAGSGAVLIVIDSPGVVSVGPALITPVVESRVPVIVYVPQGASAAGGAAFLAAAADVVAMAPDATVGPAVPFELSQGEPGTRDPTTEGLSEYTILWRLLDLPDLAARRAGAELAGQVLTTDRAVSVGVADDVIADQSQLMTALAVAPGAQLQIHDPTPVRRLLHAAVSPTAAFVLLLLTTVALLMLFGWPATATLVVAALAPLTVVALVVLPAHWWAILLTAVGVFVLAVDIGVIWFGLPTVVGTTMIVAGGRALVGGAPVLRVPMSNVAAAGAVAVIASLAARHFRKPEPVDETDE